MTRTLESYRVVLPYFIVLLCRDLLVGISLPHYVRAFLGNSLLLTMCPGIPHYCEVLNIFPNGFGSIVSLLLLGW
jgi:hypothetical protein